jgi:7-cyano-7-deazaguanine synthase in queuosine biosynthesis
VKRFAVVVNDCAAPPVPAISYVRSRETDYGGPNFTLRFDDLVEGLPRQLNDRELDWLEILGHLFAIDIACERGDGDVEWNRTIHAWLPVRDPAYWNGRRSEIEGIWTDLTDDDLEMRFEAASDADLPPRMGTRPFPNHDGVALLSGGQDSFVGALDLISAGGKPLLLSHSGSGATNTAQAKVEEHLRQLHPNLHRMKLSARRKPDTVFPGGESSQRTRTFLFVGAACVVAAVGGSNKVWLNENGIMALHLPLTEARIGSLSTHTASPPIVERMGALASDVLGADLGVDNHLVGMTKPEVVERAVHLGAGAQLQDTVSCWSIGRTRTHCGFCAPCLLRRISCETHSVADVDYDADLFDDPASLDDPRARDNLAHLIAFIDELGELDDVELEYEYPELMSGEPAISLADAIALHRRWVDQASAVLFSHPVPTSLR